MIGLSGPDGFDGVGFGIIGLSGPDGFDGVGFGIIGRSEGLEDGMVLPVISFFGLFICLCCDLLLNNLKSASY
jgi:hypothetical protein